MPTRSLRLAAAAAAGALALGAGAPEDPYAPFVEPGFPFIVSTVDAGKLGPAFPARNLAVRCVILMLGDDTYACFDTDLLRVAVAWRGEFVSLTTMAQVSYQQPGNKNNAIPRVLGRPITATGVYAGWSVGAPSYEDPRPAGPNPDAVGRGPLDPAVARWRGVQVAGREAVLSYTVGGTDVREQVSAVRAGGEVGVARTFDAGAVRQPLSIAVAEVADGAAATVGGAIAVVTQGTARDSATVVGVVGVPAGARLAVDGNRHVALRLPAGAPASRFRVVTWRGRVADTAAVTAMLREPVRMAGPDAPNAAHWPGEVVTRGVASADSADYVLDRLTLPNPNPWRRNVRAADVAFFADGRAAVVTFEGDVWVVSGIDRALGRLAWRRFASGLYEPLNVAVVRDTVYVHDRQGIVRLVDANGDGEADRYESFTNLTAQSGESREFPLGMGVRPGGGFYLAIGGALDLGPKTSPAIMTGFRAGSRQSGTVQEVSADGRGVRAFATGLREPIIGVDPRTGTIAASDQQGNFVPSTPIFLLRDGGYYGVPATAHGADTTRLEKPLLWIPHEVDQSGAGEVWVPEDSFVGGRTSGLGASGATRQPSPEPRAPTVLVHLSYGRPGPFRVYVDSTRSGVQGALVALPGEYRAPTLKGRVGPDGQLYLAGFSVWGSNAKEVASVVRLRRTALPNTLPVAVRAGLQGVLVRFASPLDPAALAPSRFRLRRWNYVRSQQYGSGHFKLDGTAGEETLPVAAHLSADGRALLLVAPDMRPAMQLQLDYDVRTRAGATLRNALWLTAHAVDSLDLAREGFRGGALDWRASARRAATVAARAAAAPTATAAATAAGSAALGARLYREKGCQGCHSVDGTTAGKTGPTFRGLYGAPVRLTNGRTVTADDAFLRRAILDPAAEIVQGYEPGMPSFKGVLSEGELRSLVLYIRSLGGPARR